MSLLVIQVSWDVTLSHWLSASQYFVGPWCRHCQESNMRNHWPNDTVSHPRRPEASAALLWKHLISQTCSSCCRHSCQIPPHIFCVGCLAALRFRVTCLLLWFFQNSWIKICCGLLFSHCRMFLAVDSFVK
jgi:hypothetical protein